MGLFDQMFGKSASAENEQQRFAELRSKYQSLLNVMEQHQVQLQNLHVQDDKLFIKGTVSSQDAKDQIWSQMKLLKDYETDLTCDINVEETRLAGGSW